MKTILSTFVLSLAVVALSTADAQARTQPGLTRVLNRASRALSDLAMPEPILAPPQVDRLFADVEKELRATENPAILSAGLAKEFTMQVERE